ncbi:hypothetical protein PR048_014143 [Dryococelus australis]|uniref:HTH psq-type domain-containing protein n=1 Tax=Dryococelus australis TaxID=614101 RepID=A0ABQ9HDH7_9NEOP|nr:hypothetical protein PR048_014143 [Dryococelus australis]
MMVCTYKKKTTRGEISAETIKAAVLAVKRTHRSIRGAQEYGKPFKTLARYCANYQELLQPRSVTTQPVVALPLAVRTQTVARLLPEAETRQLYASSQTEPASQNPEPEIQQNQHHSSMYQRHNSL